ncbi:TspO/MBR family protein [Geojedonia litorea]|uniref:TspO/MBR family protein n=1 Tax=Geojedonia litorea TaxID=1268269 RepID=A0ABV9N1D8_9FLAO
MKIVKFLVVFLIINFGGLALGRWLMDNGPSSQWYLDLNKAPWTPPGWVFGVAWTTIMICFSIYLAFLFKDYNSRYLRLLFSIQVLLNVIWNYLFFNLHQVSLGLLVIGALTLVLFYFFFKYRIDSIKYIRYLLLPYMIWLCIATSLNAYILLYN